MTRWLVFCFFSIASTALAASEVTLGCGRLELVLDPRLNSASVEAEWGTGHARSEVPAVLELRGCKGQLLERLTLQGPLARLDSTPLRGAPARTYLVSVDLTAEAGSYSGPLTIPVQVIRNHLVPATARTPDGHIEPIQLALTGKAAWKEHPVGNIDELLSVSSQAKDHGFITFYRRYHPTRQGWQLKIRIEPGLWESDSEFPEVRLFP